MMPQLQTGNKHIDTNLAVVASMCQAGYGLMGARRCAPGEFASAIGVNSVI